MPSRRLIEETFPLKKVSEDSKVEKNVRQGHISTLHIWPARRPLAASRAAIIAALMPDPGDEQGRRELNKKIESITRWGTENGPALEFFRKEIRKAYGGRAPRVLDMFAGGGTIPLEAMRLGCDVTAIDYNPVAWFILKCTLEFPQKLAGKTWPLPKDVGKKQKDEPIAKLQQLAMLAEAEGKPGTLADHVRYWGNWVMENARAELEPYYPLVNGKPTVAYLWARTVPCPDPACGAEVPLLKTLWLCKKEEKNLPDTPENRARPDFLRVSKTRNTSSVVINARRGLRLLPNTDAHCVDFEIWTPGSKDEVPEGTMAGAKSRCPVCGVNITPEYIKESGSSGKMHARMTCSIFDTDYGKDYKLSSKEDEDAILKVSENFSEGLSSLPYGLPNDIQQKNSRTFITQLYGLTTWDSIFTHRQLLSLATFAKKTLVVPALMKQLGYSNELIEAIRNYLAIIFNKLADYSSTICVWELHAEEVKHTFQRFALPMTWDFSECNPISDLSRYYLGGIKSVESVLEKLIQPDNWGQCGQPRILRQSATDIQGMKYDAIITDPPYYDAIPYADISDFFYVWLRRLIGKQYIQNFTSPLTIKTEELALRLPHIGMPDEHTPKWYETGMATVFRRAWEALEDDGRMVIVFAHKDPLAWETLVSAMILAGLTVTASWPIDTEMRGGIRNLNRASLSSSIWLVCKKRPYQTGVGRYVVVRRAMQERITERLRYFWDMGISGPDFVWAAVGPALESYSAYDEVRRMDGSTFTVGEFLREVRRMVADFALGQILKGKSTEGLDEWSRYYLIHRNLFKLDDAPVGECILLSQGYGLDLNDLKSPRGILTKASKKAAGEVAESDIKGSGSSIRLFKWDERKRDDLGDPNPSGGLPLIDMLHRLMWLWASGDTVKLRTYTTDHGLSQNDLFWSVAQAILEMAEPKSRERTLLEAIVAWGRVGKKDQTVEQASFPGEIINNG